MQIRECKNLITMNTLKVQQAPTLSERSTASRGIALANMSGSLISLATSAIATAIANNQKKYAADYRFGLTELYFYDQLSNEGPFDPVGMQFGGFELVRTFQHKHGGRDTAMIAEFEVDTSNAASIINNSVFRLRVKKFQMHYAKAKLHGNKQELNMDLEIDFLTSYVNEQGAIFDSVVLGKCFLMVRKAPLDTAAPGYEEYYKHMEGELLKGRSFIVPRSFGYHREADGEAKQGYSQGMYSIVVKVKESSKDRFVDKIIMENAPTIINQAKANIKVGK
jgi:hypothetical protein